MLKKSILTICVLLILGKIAISACFFYYESPGPLTQAKVVVIEKGSGFRAIVQQLEDEGVVDHWLWVAAPALVLGKQTHFKPGEYEFEPYVTPKAIIEMLASGDIIMRRLTIPEGLTSEQVVALVNAESALSGEITAIPDEGSLLPETYYFERGESRQQVISRMQHSMKKVLLELWPTRQDGLPFETQAEAITLASIVEKEARLAEERSHVASVYVNRLHKGMKLQADPTTIYAIELEEGKPMGRLLLRKDLRRDLPHNTYMREGLPPTPIANPGRAAIEATLNPKHTKDIFFVARGDGGHYFAETYAEHKRNIVKYKAALKE